ncbi:MlaD family protein [Massilia sp. S19_KUP03_FR1]|uniref:MlaD family protein n=1 Tax=Massilia sp. S19_KUP03_FR1 TaxID=3025503 RepID=UPI002FCDB955
MENRSHALMTGIFTLVLLAAAVLAGLWFNRDRTERIPFQIATTQSIPGLNPQAAVRYRGLEVGRIDEIVFDPRATGQILIKLSVDTGSPITTTTFASLGYQGVTGIAFIQLDDDSTGSPLLPSSEKQVARIPLRPGLLDQIEKRGLAILNRTEHITDSLDKMLNPENAAKITKAIDNIGNAAEAFAAIPARLEPTISRIPAITAKFDRDLDSFGSATTNVASAAKRYEDLAASLQAPDGAINRLNSTLTRVSASVDGVTSNLELQTLPHLTAMTDEAKLSLRAVKRTANSLTDRPQSILFGAPNATPGPGEPGFVAPNK